MATLTGLSIGDLAAESGINEATLRTGGHRRYSEQDLGAVRWIVRARAGGLSLASALERARYAAGEEG